jgi:transposase InsO family protein
MLHDRSSAPARRRHATPPERINEIERLRRQRMSGPAIAHALAMPVSTVGAILRRLGPGRLNALDERPQLRRYQRERPGEMIHIDTRKPGRIDGIGHRITGERTGQSNKRGPGWEFLHVAVDDASRLACTEVLASEKREDAIGFLTRSLAFFRRHGVTVERVMTDNGSACRSRDFRDTMKEQGLRHIRTRPCTPRTNGKAERFIQTSLREWAYANAYATSAERTEAMSGFLTRYNTARPHTALERQTPWARLNNLLGNDI